jgi:hypothetical protein
LLMDHLEPVFSAPSAPAVLMASFAVETGVLQALAQYLVTDVCTTCPPHRLGDLADLATQLHLPRLAKMCLVLRYQRKLRDGLFGAETTVPMAFDQVPPSTFVHDMLRLCESSSGDVKLRITVMPSAMDEFVPLSHTRYSWNLNDDELHAHSQILSRFAYFKTLLSSDFVEGKMAREGKAVEMFMQNMDTLKALVRYVYTGRFAGVRDDCLVELFEASRLFDLPDLYGKIETTLIRRLDEDNAAVVLQIAEENGHARLAREARKWKV